MPNLKYLSPEKRIIRYREEIKRHQGKPGRSHQLMYKIYKDLLETAQEELQDSSLHGDSMGDS